MKFLLLSSILVALLQDAYSNNCDNDINCEECENECQSCIEGYDVGRDGTCKECSTFVPHCTICYDSGDCYECEDGYGVNDDWQCSVCSEAIPHCVACHLYRVPECGECEEGYEVSDYTCIPTIPTCSVTPRPIQHYPDLYRGSIIFVDFPFQCGGSVSAVEFYAERAGTFYFSAWRPSASGDSWTLLGNNTIVSEGEGAQIFTIPSEKQMTVEATDVFGFFYEKGVYRVISSDNLHKRARDGTSSRFVRTRETLEDLSIGVSRSNLAGDGNTERIVPINAIIS